MLCRWVLLLVRLVLLPLLILVLLGSGERGPADGCACPQAVCAITEHPLCCAVHCALCPLQMARQVVLQERARAASAAAA